MTRFGAAALVVTLAPWALAQAPSAAPPRGAAAPASAAPVPASAAPVPASAAPAPFVPPSPTLSPDADAGGRTGDGGPVFNTCVEQIPDGRNAPTLSSTLPSRGKSGWATPLRIVIEHGRGETVLPNGFHVQLGGDAYREIEREGFALPDPDGGSGPTKSVVVEGEKATTTLTIPLLPLPEEPGRHELTVPPLPIAIARASGDVITLCTKPQTLVVEDPIANTPNAKPKSNPAPLDQLEEWTAAKQASIVGLIALVVGALVAWLFSWWRRRPKVLPPPPPPRPPWEVALEELDAVRRAGLIEKNELDDHFARVSDAVRKYLGGLYGFDGLESTTREILHTLHRVVPRVVVLEEIERFLRQADLVKFARLTPTEPECREALDLGEQIVRRTIPPTPVAGPVAATRTPDPEEPPAEDRA